MHKPSGVSVVIPVRDRWNLAKRAVQSALDQSVEPYEIIVVDDGSKDNSISLEVPEGKSRVQVKRYTPGVNAAYARNVGISCASGKYIAFLDSDDWWLRAHLQSAISCIENKDAVGVVGAYWAIYSRCEELHFGPPAPEPRPDGMLKYLFERGGNARTSTMVVSRQAAERTLFDERLYKHQDWDFAVRLAGCGCVAYNPHGNVCVDHSAGGRMSGKANIEATFRFLRKFDALMTPAARNGFLIWSATSAALRQDRRAVFRMLAELAHPRPVLQSLRAIGLKVVVLIPGFPRLIARCYLGLVWMRNRVYKLEARS